MSRSLCIVLGVLTLGVSCLQAAETEAVQKEREARFAKLLTGSRLVGAYSIDGKTGSKEDKYELVKAEKSDGDRWIFTARMKIKDQTINVPLAIDVKWAGDTPMMVLDDLTIPGLGTFSSRIMFHGNRYAGTWQHGDHGGCMWGVVESAEQSTNKPTSKPAN